jgi:hypothetical protein
MKNNINLIREGMKPAPVKEKPEVSSNLPFEVTVGVPGADTKALDDAETALQDLTILFNSPETELNEVNDNIKQNDDDLDTVYFHMKRKMRN